MNGDSGPAFLNLVSSLCVAPDGSLWVGTPGAGIYCVGNQGTVHYTTANGLADNNITAVAADSKGVIWAGTAAGDLQWIADGEIKTAGADIGLPAAPVTAILAAQQRRRLGRATATAGFFAGRTVLFTRSVCGPPPPAMPSAPCMRMRRATCGLARRVEGSPAWRTSAR